MRGRVREAGQDWQLEKEKKPRSFLNVALFPASVISSDEITG
jgi:hypothetical protein